MTAYLVLAVDGDSMAVKIKYDVGNDDGHDAANLATVILWHQTIVKITELTKEDNEKPIEDLRQSILGSIEDLDMSTLDMEALLPLSVKQMGTQELLSFLLQIGGKQN